MNEAQLSFFFFSKLAIAKGVSPEVLTVNTAVKMREFVAEKIIGHAKPVERDHRKCEMPGCANHTNDKSVVCDVCGRWAHNTRMRGSIFF